MRVFISWSGAQSKALAEILHQWLPAVIQALRPYFTPDDIAKGTRWATEISKVLEDSRVGLLCITRESAEAPWVMFEAGALAKSLDKSRVIPILFELEPADLTGPLVQFQAARFDKTDIKRVLTTINGELGDGRLAQDVLENVFDMWFPQLESKVKNVLKAPKAAKAGQLRNDRDILEEVLSLTRSLTKAQTRVMSPNSIHPMAVRDLVQGLCGVMESATLQQAPSSYLPHIEQLQQAVGHIMRRSAPEDTDIFAEHRERLATNRSMFDKLLASSATREVARDDPKQSDDDDDLPF